MYMLMKIVSLLEASAVDRASDLVLVVLVAGVFIGTLAFLIIYLNKNGKKKPEERGKGNAGGNNARNAYPTTQLLPIDGFFSGMIVQNNGMRFTAGVRCYGFDYFSSDESVQMNCIGQYRTLIKSIAMPVSLYSSYHSFDISKQITKHEQALERIRKELTDTKAGLDAFDVSITEMSMAEAMQRQEEFEQRRLQYLRAIESLEKQERHMRGMIAYLNGFTEGQEEQFQDYAYFVSYDVPADEMNEPFDVRADNAKHELEIAIHNLRARLNSAGVSAKRLSDEDLQLAMYRHAHPSGRNVSDEEILSLLGERRTVGHDGIVRTGV